MKNYLIPSYLETDFNSAKNKLSELMKESDTFRDYNYEGSNITMLIELVSYLTDMSTYFSNKIVKNIYPQSAEVYETMHSIASIRGYNPKGYISASLILTVVIKVDDEDENLPSKGDELFIPAWYKINSGLYEGPTEITYQTVKEQFIVIPSNLEGDEYSFNLTVRQGTPLIKIFSGENIINNRILIPIGTIDFGVDPWVYVNGELWKRVEIFEEYATPLSKLNEVYILEYDKFNRCNILFSKSHNIPNKDARISIIFNNTLGRNGNVTTNTFNKDTSLDIKEVPMINPIVNDFIYEDYGLININNTPIDEDYIEIINNNPSYGSSDPETIEQIKNISEYNILSQIRNVNVEDYRNHLKSHPDIIKGNVWSDPLELYGSIVIDLQPEEIKEKGKAKLIDREEWKNDGHVYENMLSGKYDIEFQDVEGWYTPDNLIISIFKDEQAIAIGNYEEILPGSLRININPAGARTGGRARLVGDTSWRTHGYIYEDLAQGEYEIEFMTINGWKKPGNIFVQIYPNQQSLIIGTYQEIAFGSIMIWLDPDDEYVRNNGGGKLVDDEGEFKPHGYVYENLPPGTYNVEFKSVEGWELVSSLVTGIEIETGQILAIGEYIDETKGSIRVYIENGPDEIFEEDPTGVARLLGIDSEFRPHNYVWHNLDTGNYSMEFKKIEGWKRPSLMMDISVTDVERVVTASYTEDQETVGNLLISLEPSLARNAGAQARIVGQLDWRDDGYIYTNLVPKTYTIEFKEIDNWTRPSALQVDIVAGETLPVQGNYTAELGSVIIYVNPDHPDIRERGAGRPVGYEDWGKHNTVYDVSPGTHMIEFKKIGDETEWVIEQTLVEVEVEAGQEVLAIGEYEDILDVLGSITIHIRPSGARNEGGQARIIAPWETEWRDDNYVYDELPSGTYTIEYKDIDGWITPEEEEIYIGRGAEEVTGNAYKDETEEYGSLQVLISPTAVSHYARWRIINGQWRQSTDTIDLPSGTTFIQYEEIDGYVEPSNKQVRINTDETTVVEGIYSDDSIAKGWLKINIEPTGIRDRGAGKITSKHSWKYHSDEPYYISEGSYYVEFKVVDGQFKPENKFVQVQAGQEVQITGEYESVEPEVYVLTPDLSVTAGEGPPTGQLRIVIEPSGARSAGAKGKLNSDEVWRSDGYRYEDLDPGSYTVVYSDIDGWETPSNNYIDVIENETVQAKGEYEYEEPTTGSIRGELRPSDVQGTGKWRIVTIDSAWMGHMEAITGVDEGTVTVEFSDVSGWDTPGAQSVNVVAGQEVLVTGTYSEPYVPPPPPPEPDAGIRVVINPSSPSEVRNNARAKLNDPTYTPGQPDPYHTTRAHGYVWDDVTIGQNYTIEFTDISGWDTPSGIVVYTEADRIIDAEGRYTPTEPIEPEPTCELAFVTPGSVDYFDGSYRKYGIFGIDQMIESTSFYNAVLEHMGIPVTSQHRNWMAQIFDWFMAPLPFGLGRLPDFGGWEWWLNHWIDNPTKSSSYLRDEFLDTDELDNASYTNWPSVRHIRGSDGCKSSGQY